MTESMDNGTVLPETWTPEARAVWAHLLTGLVVTIAWIPFQETYLVLPEMEPTPGPGREGAL
jgi:hypothetical protein